MTWESPRKRLGRFSEEQAAEFLIRKGLVKLASNLTFRQGEIDLLMQDGETIVLVEVKSQRSNRFSDPIYKVSPIKQKKLRLLAEIIAAKYPEQNIRIDAVTLYLEENRPVITHYENILN